MKQNKIAIRCIGSTKKGFGNFNRSLTLAEELRKKKYTILFLIDKNPQIINELLKRKFQYIVFSKFNSLHRESVFIIDLLNKKNLNFLILDSREKGEILSKFFFMMSKIKTILLDDAWVNEAWADLIINGTMIKQYQKYIKFNKNSKIFVGTKYFILNKSFSENKKIIKEIKEKNKYDVVISMGGSDPHGLTFKILNSICGLDNIRIKVILGPLMKDNIQQYEYDKKSVLFVKSPKFIWNNFKKADLVISNAGNTLFELATQSIPTICIPVIEHQVPYAKFFHTNGFAINLGFWKNVKNKDIEKNVIKLLNNTDKRKKMSSKGNEIIDGNGLFRVIKIIEFFSKKFT